MTPNLERHGTEESLSDEALGIGVAVARVDLGATVIEKHFTLRRADKGPDCEFPLEPKELTRLCEEVKAVWAALGSAGFSREQVEEGSRVFRRYLYIVESVKKGERLTLKNLRSSRPRLDIEVSYIKPFKAMSPKKTKKETS